MRTWWSAPAAAGLLALAACSGQGTDATATSVTTSAAPRGTASSGSASQTSPRSPAPSTASRPRATTNGPAPRPTTASPHPTSTSSLPAALQGLVLTAVPTSRKVVALTFDGGAGSQGAASILATLRAQRVPASFFVTGPFAKDNPGTTRQMAAIGPVGNHSWNHQDFTTLTASAISDELATTRAAVLAVTGRDPRPYFRFPYGDVDARVLKLVNNEGYGAIGWSTDSLGWKGVTGGMTVGRVVARVLAGRTPGQVVLMHVGANPDDGTTLDADALPRIIAGYRASGYGFVTLDVLR